MGTAGALGIVQFKEVFKCGETSVASTVVCEAIPEALVNLK